MSFPSFPLQNFRGALSLSLALSLRSRACACSLIVRSLFFLVYNFEGLSGRISSLFCFYPWISHGEFLQKRKLLLLLSTSLHLCFNVFLGRSLFSGLFVVCISFVSRQILLGDCAPAPPHHLLSLLSDNANKNVLCGGRRFSRVWGLRVLVGLEPVSLVERGMLLAC